MSKKIRQDANARGLWLCAVVALALAGLSACSDDAIKAAGEEAPTTSDAGYSPVKVITDQSVLGKYVTNYKSGASRAGEITSAEELEMPISIPEKPETYILTSAVSNYYWFADEDNTWGGQTHSQAKTQVVEADTEYNATSCAPIGQTIYVYGHLTISGWGTSPSYAGDCVIYVMPGGELTFGYNGGLPNSTGNALTIYNWGKLTSTTGNGEYSTCNIQGVTIHSATEIGDIEYLTFHGSEVYAYGGIEATYMNVTGSSYVYCNCNMIVNDLTVQNSSEISTQYLKAKKATLMGNDEYHVICIRNGGLWEVGELYLQNCDHIQVGAPEGKSSLIIADYTSVNSLDLQKTFVNTYLNCTSWGGDNRAAELFNNMTSDSDNFSQYFASDCYLNIATTENVREDDSTCAAKIFVPGDEEEDDENDPFEEIADIDATHVHPISATCIAVDGNEAYVSWHLRGGNVWGCLEKITVANDQVTLNSWIETPAYLAYEDVADDVKGTPRGVSGKEIEDINGASMGNSRSGAHDFNHIIIQDNNLIAVGDHDTKGGFIGMLPLSAFMVEGQLDEVFTSKQLGKEVYEGDECVDLIAGRSGNSVVYSNGQYLVTSRGGYQSYNFDGETFKVADAANTDGSVKHIAIDGAGNAYTIEYTVNSPNENWWNDYTSTISSTIKKWDVSNGWDVTASNDGIATTNEFGPIFGKDVIEYNDGKIYSCQGWNGVYVYGENGSEVASFNVAEWVANNPESVPARVKSLTNKELLASAANGLCVDGDYCYVAYGGAGVWMLNKNTMEPVAAYCREGDTSDEEYYGTGVSASANYVKVMNANGQKYLIVAYGRAGVRVLKVNV